MLLNATFQPIQNIQSKICLPSVSEAQISLRCALNVFELQATSREAHWMTTKWHWILQGQIYSMYVLLVSLGPKFQSVSVYGQLFWVSHMPVMPFMLLWDKCTECLPNELEHYRVKFTNICQISNVKYEQISVTSKWRVQWSLRLGNSNDTYGVPSTLYHHFGVIRCTLTCNWLAVQWNGLKFGTLICAASVIM